MPCCYNLQLLKSKLNLICNSYLCPPHHKVLFLLGIMSHKLQQRLSSHVRGLDAWLVIFITLLVIIVITLITVITFLFLTAVLSFLYILKNEMNTVPVLLL